MRLEDQIRELEQQKTAEISALKQHSVRATRNIKRALSPDRAIRKHIGIAMLAAALAGMIVAPGPKYANKSEIREEIRKARKGSGSRIMQMLGKFIPGMDRIAPQPQSEPESHAPSQGIMGLLLGQVMTMLLGRVDIHSLLAQFLGHQASSPQTSNNHAQEPNVSVGDAGTGRPQN